MTTETIAPPHQGDHHAEDVASLTHNRWALALVGLVLALFLIHGWSTIGARFGDSHDGRNAGTWATGSQSLREEGPVESRLGATSSLRGTYANHPPLIYVETALAEAIGGSARAATRAPAWLGSLAVIVLLTMLLREAGLRMISSAMAVATVVATPMFLIYGTMLDTPITSLPFGVALLIVWQRIRQGRHVRPIVAALLAGLAPLAGWAGPLGGGCGRSLGADPAAPGQGGPRCTLGYGWRCPDGLHAPGGLDALGLRGFVPRPDRAVPVPHRSIDADGGMDDPLRERVERSGGHVWLDHCALGRARTLRGDG